MPEIAEVRVVANTLKKQILGKRITGIKILYPNIINGDSNTFRTNLLNCEFFDIRTTGKWLIFDLGKYSFLSHLRMEGKYFYVKRSTPISKHTHVIFQLDNGMDLRYDDVRKFGKMELVKTTEINDNPSIKKLGIEPDNANLTVQYLTSKFKDVKKPIKTVLLDQTIINGLGNIYANEVLYAAKISPFRLALSLSSDEIQSIIYHSNRIITKSCEVGGCTIRSYTSSLGVVGHYQDYLLVHGKGNFLCKNCRAAIKQDTIGGRTAYYCETCQK